MMSVENKTLSNWRSELIKEYSGLADCPRLTREEITHANRLARWIEIIRLAVKDHNDQLTAAQQRVVELEREKEHREKRMHHLSLRVNHLTKAWKEYQRVQSVANALGGAQCYATFKIASDKLTADNDRLRALLRECYIWLELQGSAVDLRDRIKAAIGE